VVDAIVYEPALTLENAVDQFVFPSSPLSPLRMVFLLNVAQGFSPA